jgi:signal transduction histidine kinase
MRSLTPQSVAAYPPSSPAILWLAPRRVLLWVYLTRFAISASIFLAAVLVWQLATPADTLLASLVFAGVMLFTAGSFFYTEISRHPITQRLLYIQMLFDVVVVTAVVHVTWDGNTSQFAPLYILVIAVAALLLPGRGVTIVSAFAITLYAADVIWVEGVVAGLSVTLQFVVFGIVAIGSGLIAGRLREAGRGREELAEELARFRLRQADVERLHLRAERLEAIAELSASMAHEIKNPLAAIRSAVEQIAASPRTTDDERLLTTLVQREADRLSRLLTGFLDFARVDVPQMRVLDIGVIVENAGALAEAHPERPERVRIEYDLPRVSLEVEGNEDMLHRALFNLILNAVQASPPDGVVRIEATTLLPNQLGSHITAFGRGAVAVRVIDQGDGISEDIRARLFHPFFTTKGGGNGLGLAIVHRVVEAHRGVVVVDGPPDDHALATRSRGAQFTVLLPRP